MNRHRWKEYLEIRKFTKSKGDTSEASKDIAPQSHKILQTFVWWGTYT